MGPLREAIRTPTLATVDDAHTAGLAVAAASAGDKRQAASAIARLRGRDLARLPRSSTWLVTMYAVVEAANLLPDKDTAATVYGLLEPYERLPMMASLGVACFGSVHHALGVAALTANDRDRAVKHLKAAVQANIALGHRPATEFSRARLAQALRDDEPKGITCVREGRRWVFRLGAHTADVQHSVGMGHLATLLANPGREVPAIALALDDDHRLRLARAELPRAELDQILGQDGEERARIAVGKAIRRAIARVAAANPLLGKELATSVHTGLRCYYRPL